MALSTRRSERITNIWPGFVDSLATLLMVIIFLLLVFVLAQFFLSQALSGRDAALHKLEDRVSELTELLSLERAESADLRLNVSQLSQELQASVAQRDDLQSALEASNRKAEGAKGDAERIQRLLDEANQTVTANKSTIEIQLKKLAALSNQVEALQALKAELEQKISGMASKLDEGKTALLAERNLSESARAQVALLNQQMKALREQMAAIQAALDASEKLASDQKVQIASLGKRLNAALATKVQELSRYRSEFFGRLREVLGNQPGIRIVGDRFVFQSEVLFASGSAELNIDGKAQLLKLAETLDEISKKIPKDINWVLQVDGHTDKIPIHTPEFPSNWELSTARAISVVKFLIDMGISPDHLAATGYGQYQPIDPRDDEIAYRRNRRIELKLTSR